MSITDLPNWLYSQAMKIVTDMAKEIMGFLIDMRKKLYEMKEASQRERKAKVEADIAEASKENCFV